MPKPPPDHSAESHAPPPMPGTALTPQALAEVVRHLAQGALSVRLFAAPPLQTDTADLLNRKPRLTVAFPPCTDELLALVRTHVDDEITTLFGEYFKFAHHKTFGQAANGDEPYKEVAAELDGELVRCLAGHAGGAAAVAHTDGYPAWPSECCICTPCVTLEGKRNSSDKTPASLKRLFIGDVLWLYFFDRMGINQILGAILDAFAYSGKLPISNGSIDLKMRDDLVALVLEVMVRQTKMGMSTTVRDRGCLFRTTLGWVNEAGRKLRLDSELNSGFNTLFHKFIYHALEFYRDRRLAIAIQGAAGGIAPPSAATLVTIGETLEVLKKRFEPFQYGRNYYNTLSGIVWTIAGLTVIRELASTLGIPTAYNEPYEYIPAAYDLLVLKRPVTQGEVNRYIVHRECASKGRDILLDLEVIDHTDTSKSGALEGWLEKIERKVEAYRTSYRAITGVDLGASPTATIEQAAA